MPFSFHDKLKPTDKYRGKTRDEFLDDVRDRFDREKRMFFDNEKRIPWDSMPSAAGSSRGGFFDDDMMPRGGRGDIRSHLDDLAQRHPEFAAQLRGPAWGSEMWAGEGDSSTSESRQEQEQSDEPGPLRGRPRNNLPQHGLRNTVPDMGQRQAEELKEEARGQRSWSAPPDSRLPREQQRFVSRININPVNPDEQGDVAQPQPSQASDNQGKPPPVPQPQQPKPGSNVRHIPIFVEGRDEPILPKNVDAEAEHLTSQAQHQFHPQNRPFPQQKRPFQSPQSNPPQHKQPNRSFNVSPKPFQQPSMHSNFPHQQSGPFTQHHQQPPQQQPSSPSPQANVPTDSRPKTPEPPRPKVANDPILRVQAIQKEVAALKEQVEKYPGNSRQDSDYIYLDEMLTRNLIKLDNIETEGKENIRATRRDAIRSIQQCINILEGKVPSPQEQEQGQPMEEAESPVARDEDTSAGASEAAGDPVVESEAVESMSMDVEEQPEKASEAESSSATEHVGTTTEENSATPAKTDEEKPKA